MKHVIHKIRRDFFTPLLIERTAFSRHEKSNLSFQFLNTRRNPRHRFWRLQSMFCHFQVTDLSNHSHKCTVSLYLYLKYKITQYCVWHTFLYMLFLYDLLIVLCRVGLPKTLLLAKFPTRVIHLIFCLCRYLAKSWVQLVVAFREWFHSIHHFKIQGNTLSSASSNNITQLSRILSEKRVFGPTVRRSHKIPNQNSTFFSSPK